MKLCGQLYHHGTYLQLVCVRLINRTASWSQAIYKDNLMGLYNLTHLLFIIIFLLFGATLFKVVVLTKSRHLLLQKLNDANDFVDQIKEEYRISQEKNAKIKNFKESLAIAELTTRLQEPQLSAEQSSSESLTPEKYRLVNTLIQKSMGLDEIASFLRISTYEAKQIITLSKLAT